MIERVVLVLLLAAPFAMLLVATRLRRAREAGGGTGAHGLARPWDKSLRNGMLLAIGGFLLAGSGLFAFSRAAASPLAPLFGAPVILGVVLLVAGYRTWMRGVAQVPDDAD